MFTSQSYQPIQHQESDSLSKSEHHQYINSSLKTQEDVNLSLKSKNQFTNSKLNQTHYFRLFILIIFFLIINQSPKISHFSQFNQFEVLNDYFIQTDLKTNSTQFNVYKVNSSFGLVHQIDLNHWNHFTQQIQNLNSKRTNLKLSYKVIFIARHGEGFHNLAESKYGTPMWDCYWSELNGDQNLTWGPDSRLSLKGQNQIKLAKDSWKREVSNSLPLPTLFITSPLSRAIETMEITSVWNISKNNVIEVREGWRENIGLHTCDLRRSRQEIFNEFEFLKFENGFKEFDELWTKDFQETSEQLDLRIYNSLQHLFNDSNDQKHTYISITTHSGVINSLLRVIGHRPFPTQTGGMIPLVIKGSISSTPTRPPLPGPSATKPDCPTDSLSRD